MSESPSPTEASNVTPRPPRRWWQFSLSTMVIVVALICVVLGLWSAEHHLRVREIEESLQGSDTSLHNMDLRAAYSLPHRDKHRILANYAAVSPKRAWFAEQEVVLFLDDRYEEYRSEEFVVSVPGYYRQGENAAEGTITSFGEGLDIVAMRAVDEKHVEIVYTLLDPLADYLGVERGRVWTAMMKLEEWIAFIDKTASFSLGYFSPHCQWLMDHSTATGEVVAVPGDEAAR